VAFGSEVHDRARPVASEHVANQGGVGNVTAHEGVARIAAQRIQISRVAGVGYLVEVDERLLLGSQPVEHEVRADEACSARHEYGHDCVRSSASVPLIE
jgi:hypothetical protein